MKLSLVKTQEESWKIAHTGVTQDTNIFLKLCTVLLPLHNYPLLYFALLHRLKFVVAP